MSIWGKIIGGAAGFALGGGPLGALIGAGMGHMVDRQVSSKNAAPDQKITFTIGVIALSAKMAKADGTVTPDEVEAFQKLFQVPAHEADNVERVYKLAMQDTAGFEAYAKQLADLYKDRELVLEDLLDALFYIAHADGVVHPDELEYLRKVSEIFGFSEDKFEKIRARHLGPDRTSPYAVLGVDPEINDDELKKAYRQLIKDNHPDRLISQGVPREFITVANDRLAAINAAYDRICVQRGIS